MLIHLGQLRNKGDVCWGISKTDLENNRMSLSFSIVLCEERERTGVQEQKALALGCPSVAEAVRSVPLTLFLLLSHRLLLSITRLEDRIMTQTDTLLMT